ncbi:MAG: hypothetical protein ACYCZM_07340 [Acidimicrobiales bacterium]
MNDELDTLSRHHADLEHPPGQVGADENREFAELEDSDRVP